MFFLLTNISIGKCYPNIMTQFSIGIVCYAIIFFILKDFVTDKQYQKYKYYLGIAIVMDTAFLVYQYKYNSMEENEEINNTIDVKNIVTDIKPAPAILTNTKNKSQTTTEMDISFSSNIEDFKVSLDLSPEMDRKNRLPVADSETKNIKIAGYNNNNLKSIGTDSNIMTFSLT